MNKTLVAAITALALSLSAHGVGYTIKTLDGQTLTDVHVVTNVQEGGDSVRLRYSDGIIIVRLANLSAEDKKILGIQAWLDLIEKRNADHISRKTKSEGLELAGHKLSKEINAADYPPELRTCVERYNLNVASSNTDLINAAPDVHEVLALLASSATPESNHEAIQREFEQWDAFLTKEEKRNLKGKANEEQYTLQVAFKALEDYKAMIGGANNQGKIRKAVARGETFEGMPYFALQVLKGEPYKAECIGSHEKRFYLNAKGFFDIYYLEDGTLVSEEHHCPFSAPLGAFPE